MNPLHTRRAIGTALAAVAALSLAGCAGHWHHPVEADGRYCHRLGTLRTNTCTPQAVPTEQADLDAKRFAADPAALTVLVVRHHWADSRHVVPFSVAPTNVDGGTTVQTVPESFVRLRLRPGRHRLTLTWAGQTATTMVEGQAGDLRFVQLVGETGTSASTFQWSTASDADARSQATKARLVADLELRSPG